MQDIIQLIVVPFGALVIGYLLGYLHAIMVEDEHRKRRDLEERIKKLEGKT